MQAETVTVREPNVTERELWASYLEPPPREQGETVREVNMSLREPTAAEREPKVKEREHQETVREEIVTIREPVAMEREPSGTEREQGQTVREVDAIVREPTATGYEPYGREPYDTEREQQQTVREVETTVADQSASIQDMQILAYILLAFGIIVLVVGIYLVIAFTDQIWVGMIVAISGLAIVALGVFLYRRRRRRAMSQVQVVQDGDPVVTGSVPVGQGDLSSYPLGPHSYSHVPASAPPQPPPSYKDALQI